MKPARVKKPFVQRPIHVTIPVEAQALLYRLHHATGRTMDQIVYLSLMVFASYALGPLNKSAAATERPQPTPGAPEQAASIIDKVLTKNKKGFRNVTKRKV